MSSFSRALPFATLFTASLAAAEPVKFVPHAIKESETGAVAVRALIPAGWKTDDKLVWTFDDADVPVRYRGSFTGPDGISRVDFYPDVIGNYSTGPGYATGVKPPADTPAEVLKFAIKKLRSDVRYKVVKEESTKPSKSSQQIGYGQQSTSAMQSAMIRISYDLNGKSVEEDFFCTICVTLMVSDGAAHLETLLWRCCELWSVRAPKGDVEHVRKLGQTMRASAFPTIEFFDEIQQVKKILLETGLERIRQIGVRAAIHRKAANEISQTIVDSYWATQRSNEARASQFSDYIRGVEPYRDRGTTVKLPSGYREVWSNGLGEYLMSDAVGYDPSKDFRGTWTRIERMR